MDIMPLLKVFNSVLLQEGKALPLITLILDTGEAVQSAITGDKDTAPLSITAHFHAGRALIRQKPDSLAHIDYVFSLAVIPFSVKGDNTLQETLAASMYEMETKEIGVFMYQFRRNQDGTLVDAHERKELYRKGDDAQPMLAAFVAGMHSAHRSDDNADRKLQEIIDRYGSRIMEHHTRDEMRSIADQFNTWKRGKK